MNSNDKDLEIRHFEQETHADEDLETMVPPLWSRSTFRVMLGTLVVLAIIAFGVLAIG